MVTQAVSDPRLILFWPHFLLYGKRNYRQETIPYVICLTVIIGVIL